MSFSVVTYNILANAYINREWYPRTPDEVLEPALRRSALLAHLVELGVDLFCLQEVEQDAFAAIEAHLEPLGYKGFFSQKGRKKPDGCAILYRSAIFEFQEAKQIEYTDAQPGRAPSGHVAQFLSLEHEFGRVGIANTHLKWDKPGTPRGERYGYQQAAQLLQEREKIPDCTAWIICGDMNATPDNELIALIQEAGFKFSHAGETDAYTSNNNSTTKMIDYLFYNAALSVEPLPLPVVDLQTVLPGSTQPSDHIAVAARFTWRPTGDT